MTLLSIYIIVREKEREKERKKGWRTGCSTFRENGKVTRKEVEELLGAGATKAFRLLRELCEERRLEAQGSGKLSCYKLK